MALNSSHASLERRSGADLRDRIRGRLVFASLTFTGFTGSEVPAGGKVELIYPDEPAAADNPGTVSTSRTPNWNAASTLGSEMSELEINRNTNMVVSLPHADIESSPFSQIQTANDRISRVLARTIDDDLADAFIAGATTGNTKKYGSNTNYVAADGTAHGTGRELVVDAFIDAAKWALANGFVGTGEREYDFWAVVPGGIWGTWLDYIKEEKPSDSLFNMFVGPGSRGIAQEDRQNNIRVVLIRNKYMPTATVGGKAHSHILFGTSRAMVFAAAAPIMSSVPVNRSTSGQIGASYGQAVWWGRTVLNAEQLRKAQIQQAP